MINENFTKEVFNKLINLLKTLPKIVYTIEEKTEDTQRPTWEAKYKYITTEIEFTAYLPTKIIYMYIKPTTKKDFKTIMSFLNAS